MTKVFVRDLQNKTHALNIEQNWTIRELKQHIRTTLGIKSHIKLSWNEEDLNDDATVADYSIQKGVIITSQEVQGGNI